MRGVDYHIASPPGWYLRCAVGIQASLGTTGEMLAGDVAEGHRGAERDPAAGIVTAHDAGRVIADRVQSLDRTPRGIEHSCLMVGANAGKGAQIAQDHLDRVERPAFERRHARIGLVLGVSEKAVVGGCAFAELGVLTPAGVRVDGLDRTLQRLCVDACALGQVGEGVSSY